MKLSNRIKVILFSLLLVLNVILRLQVSGHEIGYDSIEMHSMINSLTEFGYARWFLDLQSIVGIYPASYTSSMQFLISGIALTTGMKMNSIIFVYCIFLGIFSIFSAYLLGGVFFNDELFKFYSAVTFSTLPAILNYSTWTIPTRGLFIALAPIVFYLMMKNIIKINIKFFIVLALLSLFLFCTHHLFYFLIPIYFIFFVIIIVYKTQLIRIISYKERIFSRFNNKDLSSYFTPFLISMGFLFMFSIPFFTGRFVETSRYDPIFIGYIRNIGLLSIIGIGGAIFLIFKKNKNSKDWFILLSAMILVVFIYKVTYMKWFIAILSILYISIGLSNIGKTFSKRKSGVYVVTLILITSLSVSGYYQFLHHNQYERAVSDSIYTTGKWIKNSINDNCISNDEMLGRRLFSISETTHFLDTSIILDQIYGFCSINIDNYERYPLTSDDFWLSGYKGVDIGDNIWFGVNRLSESPDKYDIGYVIENPRVRR